MATSALYFSALTTSAKNFVGHRGLSIAIPIASFGLSSFWEALLAGSPLFARKVHAKGGNMATELDVVRLFKFFATMLGVVGIIGALGLVVIPSHLPKRVEGEEEATEEDALLPRAEESETSSVISAVSAREELTAEHRPFLKDRSTYLFGTALLILLGSGEMFINCVGSIVFWSHGSLERCCRQSVEPATLLRHSTPVIIYQCLLCQVPSLVLPQA